MSGKWSTFIRIKSQAGSLRSHMIEKASFTLGRTQDADLPLLSGSISRVHLILELRDHEIWATDKNSANGTFRNNVQLPPGVPVLISDADILRLGNEPDEYRFLVLPTPVELQNSEYKQISLKDSMKDLAKQFEEKAQARAEKELRRAREESEQIIAEATKHAEILKTQIALDSGGRRQMLESELARLRQDTIDELSRERLKAKRDADSMITDAQKTIQKDFADAAIKIESQLSEAHQQARMILLEAENKVQAALNEAHAEAIKLRNKTAEEARALSREAIRKGDEFLSDLKAKYAKEISEEKVHILENARIEAKRQSEQTLAGLEQSREDLILNTTKLEHLLAEVAQAKARVEENESLKRHLSNEVQGLRNDATKLQTELKRVEEIEARREKAAYELDLFTRQRAEREASIDREIKEMRDKRLLEFEDLKRAQEDEVAKNRVRALEDIKKEVEREEEKYEKTKRLRAIDLARLINDRLIPQMNNWLGDPESAPAKLKSSVEAATMDCLVHSATVLDAITINDGSIPTTVEQRDKKNKKLVYTIIAAIAIAVYLFRSDIQLMVRNSQQNSYSAKMIEERKKQAVYHPEQTAEFRGTYTDNVLYMKGYLELKSEGGTMEAWTLKLNNLSVLHPLGLSEEDIVHFVAKETNLVQRLGVLRDQIDAVYLAEGLERMRKAEDEDLVDIKKLLKGEVNYQKIRAIEKAFLQDLAKKQNK